MFDKFNQTLSFAADPPEGGGGTKTGLGGSGLVADLNTDETAPIDPPENTGGGTSADASASSTEDQ